MQFQDGPNLDMYIQSVVFTWLRASLAAILDLCPNLESTEISKTNKDSSWPKIAMTSETYLYLMGNMMAFTTTLEEEMTIYDSSQIQSSWGSS